MQLLMQSTSGIVRTSCIGLLKFKFAASPRLRLGQRTNWLYERSLTCSLLQVHVLENNTFEVLRLIRHRRNRFALINRIPPEVLALIPDFWDEDIRGQTTVALTHVCQAWREIFISHSSLGSDFCCETIDKTHVNLDCSGSAPVNAWLKKYRSPLPNGRLQAIPHAVAQLKSVVVHGTPENFHEIIAHLSHPAPLLESLRIEVGGGYSPEDGPVIATTLFNGDLSSLRELCLHGIRTELPWRNMINLTSFTLGYEWSGESSVRHLLDFFESAPYLRKIQLHHATPTFDGQTGRLVPLRCLKRMVLSGWQPPSLLFDHLLFPVDAKLITQVDRRSYSSHIPQSFDTVRALTGFTIHMHVAEFHPNLRFSGSDGEINIIPATRRITPSCRVLESLALFDPSKIERLRLAGGDIMLQDGCAISRLLGLTKNLRTLTISRCKNLSNFIPSLNDYFRCPKLEELVLDPRVDGEKFDIQRVVAMAAVRASKGMRFKSIRIVSRDKFVQTCALKLKEYVSHVECSLMVALTSDDVDSGDEDD